jgi:hypothetical protein
VFIYGSLVISLLGEEKVLLTGLVSLLQTSYIKVSDGHVSNYQERNLNLVSYEGTEADITAAHKAGSAYPLTAAQGRRGRKTRPSSGLYYKVHHC